MVRPVGTASPRRAMTIGVAATVVGSLPVFLTAAMAVQISVDLGFSEVGIGAAVGTFFGTMALASLHLGRVADQLGATLSLRIATLGAATAALAIGTAANNWASLAGGLVIAGLSAALAQPAANRLLVNRVRGQRLGTAFGLKQSAPPIASMLAGLAVPAVALTVGWRWAYVLAAIGALAVAIAIGTRPPTAPVWLRRAERVKPTKLEHPSMLLVLAIGFGFAFAASSVVLAFYVDSAVRAGVTQKGAGLVFAVASLTAIATRLLAGLACDQFSFAPLLLSAALLAAGALGIGLLATSQPTASTVGAIVALAGTWGFPGLFWYALMRAYPETPGRITGAMTPAALGGIIGPVGFGALATNATYRLAWTVTAGVALFAAAAILLGARKVAANAP